jgi:protein MAK11
MHVYDLLSLSSKPAGVVAIEPAAYYDTQGTRLTCIAVAEASSEDVPRLNDEAGDKPKRKRSESDSEGSNSESDGLNGARGVAKEDQETSEEDEEGEGEEEEEEWEGLSA